MLNKVHAIIWIVTLLFVSSAILAQNNVSIISAGDSLLICEGDSFVLMADGAESFNWSPADIFDDPTLPNPTVSPIESGYVFVTGINEGEESIDSIFIRVISNDVELSWAGQTEPICEGVPISITAVVESDNPGQITWVAAGNNDIADELTVTLFAPRGGRVIAIYESEGCVVSDTLFIDVIDFGVPILTTLDTLVCEGQQFRLASDPGSSTTIYTWTPEDQLDDASVANPLFTASRNETYTFKVESEDGVCVDSFEVSIEVTPISLRLNVQDTVLLCLGDTVNLIATVNGSTDGFSWSPDDGAISSTTDLNIEAYPDFSNFYYARYELDGCVIIDTIFIKVDSLPLNTDINVVPLEEDYCPGEEISLFSGMYNGLRFPDVTHRWEPQDPSIQSDPNGYNLFIETTVTNTYIRTITNGGCTRMDSIEIIVKEPSIELNITDTIVCPGQPVQLLILNDVTDISWSPEQWLSCSDCRNPIASPLQSIVYNITGENQECPVSASVRVNVFPLPNLVIELQPEGDIFIGDSLFLSLNSFPPLDEGAQFQWTFNGASVTTVDSLLRFADLPLNTVNVVYITENGCRVEISRTIPAKEPEYDIPNAFTPDGDMINDKFRAVLRGDVEVVEMRVYSRWGQVVYSANNNEGWDGMFRGNLSPPDVYAYFFVFRLPNGRTFQEKGDVTLLR